jgi:hypothetical protein
MGSRVFRRLCWAVALAVTMYSAAAAVGQASPTATQRLDLSVFGGLTHTTLGFRGDNLGFTAGVNLAVRGFRHYRPSVEIRGTYPIDRGAEAGFKNVLAGLKVDRRYGAFHPYVDFLAGRGQLNFVGDGDYNPNDGLIYQVTNSAVYSPGGGVDFDVNTHFSAKFDFQAQRQVTGAANGTIWSKAATVGVIYHIRLRQRESPPDF